MWNRVVGGASIAYGLALAIGSCVPAMQWLNGEWGVGVAFVIAGVFFLPFVVTYTAVGLNSAEGEEPSAEIKQRHADLQRVCPAWKVMWYSFIVFIPTNWIVFRMFGLPMNPFHGFTIGISLLSGAWLCFVYPAAKKIFIDSAAGIEQRTNCFLTAPNGCSVGKLHQTLKGKE
jgi:hypothetical protein